MKKLSLILTMFVSTSMAKGTLSFNQSLIGSATNLPKGPTLGLYIIESLDSNVFYQSWTGVRSGQWFSSDHSIMTRVNKRLNLGVGPSFEHSGGTGNTSFKLYGEFNVW